MGFGKSNRRAAPAPRAPAPPPRAPAPPPARAPAAAPPAQAPAQGPGLMGMMGSSMVGSMAGNMMANTLMGGRGEAPAAEAPAPGVQAQPSFSNAPVCAFESKSFLECMSSSNDNMDYCRSVFDQFKHCQATAAMQQQQQTQYQ